MFMASLSPAELEGIAPLLDFSQTPTEDYEDQPSHEQSYPFDSFEDSTSFDWHLPRSFIDLLNAPDEATEKAILSCPNFLPGSYVRKSQKVVFHRPELKSCSQKAPTWQERALKGDNGPGVLFPTLDQLLTRYDEEKRDLELAQEQKLLELQEKADQGWEGQREKDLYVRMQKRQAKQDRERDIERERKERDHRRLARIQNYAQRDQSTQARESHQSPSRLPGIQDPLTKKARREVTKRISQSARKPDNPSSYDYQTPDFQQGLPQHSAPEYSMTQPRQVQSTLGEAHGYYYYPEGLTPAGVGVPENSIREIRWHNMVDKKRKLR
ncbi:hypothetical protein ABW20_dc0101201 [Dactylellina cionopaga]|nr:hypothetical protein ABW20_dc0101201 [Dactylellina cionopaga]